MTPATDFQKRKVLCLSSADNSIKGSIDEEIRHIVDFINAKEQYFTCSSCSGRIVVLCEDGDCSVRKKGCRWLLTTHDQLDAGELVKAASTDKANAVLKYEPFILHVQCCDLQSAQNLHMVAIESGFRNSGLTVGKRGKFTLAVRCTQGLQVPLSNNGELLVTEEYLRFLTEKANEKMTENKQRIDRFYKALLQKLT